MICMYFSHSIHTPTARRNKDLFNVSYDESKNDYNLFHLQDSSLKHQQVVLVQRHRMLLPIHFIQVLMESEYVFYFFLTRSTNDFNKNQFIFTGSRWPIWRSNVPTAKRTDN